MKAADYRNSLRLHAESAEIDTEDRYPRPLKGLNLHTCTPMTLNQPPATSNQQPVTCNDLKENILCGLNNFFADFAWNSSRLHTKSAEIKTKDHKGFLSPVFCFLLIILVFLPSCKKEKEPAPEIFELRKYAPVDVSRQNPMHIYVHYMPWFEDKSSSASGDWGIHWTMAARNPDIIGPVGNREIASHFYPMIGPYASSDPNVIEYHLLLMKYSGIEGILFDWYGASDINDYGAIRKNTEAMIGMLDEAGLKFAVVYEDRTIGAALDQHPETDPVTMARDDMLYMEEHYFNHSNYIRLDGKPLLLLFGPEYFHDPAAWEEILYVLEEEPVFLVLNGASSQTAPWSSGEYIWVSNTSPDSRYATAGNFEYFMGGAYPGFNDYYSEGGWGEGFTWSIEYNDGITLQENLQKAKDYNMDAVQLITWNDFGEGTMIEPTLEFRYKLLEKVQDFAGVQYNASDLEQIRRLYELRKTWPAGNSYQTLLDQCFYYYVSLQTDKAKSIMDSLEIYH